MGCLKLAHLSAERHDIELTKPLLRCVYGSREPQKTHVNKYDYGARHYDPALGRWWVSDNKAETYSSFSPYAYVANNPLIFIDPNGEEIWIYYKDDEDKEQKVRYEFGMEYDGNNDFVENVINNLNEFGAASETAMKVIEGLNNSEYEFGVKHAELRPGKGKGKGHSAFSQNRTGYCEGTKSFDKGGGTIYWNPEYGAEKTYEQKSVGSRQHSRESRPGVNLLHEMVHGYTKMTGNLFRTDLRYNNGLKLNEAWATHWENNIRSQMGMPLRTHYGTVKNATGNTVGPAYPLLKAVRTGGELKFFNNYYYQKHNQTIYYK